MSIVICRKTRIFFFSLNHINAFTLFVSPVNKPDNQFISYRTSCLSMQYNPGHAGSKTQIKIAPIAPTTYMSPMNINDAEFKDLRKKLDVMGYNQTLPLLAIPLVSSLFGDFIKTTEGLRDTKKQIIDLLEEKVCWELGVEPYKCDNSRLLAECNELHLQFLKEREGFEQRICELQCKIRNLQTDKDHLQCHNAQIEHQLSALLSTKLTAAAKRTQQDSKRPSKKPFVSTVRSGSVVPAVLGGTSSALKCTKCNAGVYQKTTTTTKDGITVTHTSGQEDIDKLQNELTAASEQLDFYKRKVEARNREIRRLNDMLSGGRPPAALAKDCCFKEVGALSQDIDLLQREKTELMTQVREYQDKMHDAMQKALHTEEDKRKLQLRLDELKEAALQVEHQANCEIDAREDELQQLQLELKQLKLLNDQQSKNAFRLAGGATTTVPNDKRKLNERLNVLTRREEELAARNDKQKKKLQKMQAKLTALQKELREQSDQNVATLDEEKIRLRSERDFFQKEYLRLMKSEQGIEFLQAQIQSKDEELRTLRNELISLTSTSHAYTNPNMNTNIVGTTCSGSTGDQSNRSSDCVQAAIGRVERERDCARAELERMRCERDSLRDKQLCSIQIHSEELQSLRQRNEDLRERLRQLERDNYDLNSARMPTETTIALLQEDLKHQHQQFSSLRSEMEQLKTENQQISLLNEQNERIIADYQTRLLVTERQLHTADVRVNSLDSSRESNRNELTQLRSEVSALKKSYAALEHEKDTLLNQLDSKTERAYKLEYELKDCKEKRNSLEQKIKELETHNEKLNSRSRQRETELSETSTESKTLRHQIVALKSSRDEAIAENRHLTDKLSDAQVAVKTLKKSLEDSEQKVINMKQQLQEYVVEVKKAEDLLMEKDKECEELLSNFRNLTDDQVTLEGNNQSLELEAAESKREICELKCEIRKLKEQIQCRECTIEKLEDKLGTARASARCLEEQLEDAHDELRMLKIDLEAHKVLCDKLDVQKDKLNAELNEVNEIRKKLSKECDELRDELQKTAAFKELTTETTEQMLERMHSELQHQYEADVIYKNELQRLKDQVKQAQSDLQLERQRYQRQERLANEYGQQVQELRHNLTDDRFCQARSRQVSPNLATKTL